MLTITQSQPHSRRPILKGFPHSIFSGIAGLTRWILPQKYGGNLGWLEAGFLLLVLLALGMRLWELGGRAMHYDEAIHVYYAWRLSNWEEYIHSPWMHGPFQIEFTALILGLVGDSDFTARLGYAFFGTALVGLPYFLRDHLGRRGALLTAAMLALSPSLLYFSRFGRNDIIMAFWATSLLVLMWRYLHEGKDRYLYLASAVLAFMFATKETAYFVMLIFGVLAFLLAIPQLVPMLFGRVRWSELTGPAGFFTLIVTLTLPQWSAMSGLFQDFLGLTLVSPEGISQGIVGAPHWVEPFILLPVHHAPVWLHAVAALVLVAGLLVLSRKYGLSPRSLLPRVVTPLLAVLALFLALFQPLGHALSPESPPLLVDLPLAFALFLAGIGILYGYRVPWRQGVLLLAIPVMLTLLYLLLFVPILDVTVLVNSLLPPGIEVNTSVNGIPLNFVVAAGILATTFLVSIVLGVRWRGGVWLGCAAIFYLVWLTLYTTVFTNWAGFFSGIWQGMGYWIAQQEVARGNQPWYYYFVGLSVYELLPVVFGALGAIYFVKKGDIFGLALAFWAALTLIAYTLASEKMPWLLVNITLPFILLAGKYLGDLSERVPWRQAITQGYALLLVFTPMGIIAAVYLAFSYVNPKVEFSNSYWLLLLGVAVLAVACTVLVRLARPRAGVAMVGLGTAALLLVFGAWAAVRAAYTFDDSNREILVYAQGSADLPATYQELKQEVLGPSAQIGAVQVDYELWYPFQWYVRHGQQRNTVQFKCFKDESEDGWNASCSPVPENPQASAFLLNDKHSSRDAPHLTNYQKAGPFKNLLWFPESYRRPGENRQSEGPTEQLSKDFAFFKEAATSRSTWHSALDYIVFRNMQREWYSSEYYSYLPQKQP